MAHPFVPQRLAADPEDGAHRHGRDGRNAHAVNEGAIGRIQVRDGEHPIFQSQPAMGAGDFGIRQDNVGRHGAADAGPGRAQDKAMARVMAFDQLQAMGTIFQGEVRAAREGHDPGLPVVHPNPQHTRPRPTPD